MAVFTITDTNSIVRTTANTPAFADDSGDPDTLIVAAAAYLIAAGTGSTSVGARLAPTGAWKVTVNGSIVSKNGVGLHLVFGNTGISTITVGADGEIGGSAFGLSLGSAATVKNAGTIRSIEVFTPAGTVTTIANTGTIDNPVTVLPVLGPGILGGAGIEKVTNTGTIAGQFFLGGGDDTLKNSGTITGDVIMSSGNDTVTNTGTIAGTVLLGDGDDSFKGGKAAETVNGGAGSDNINLGAGDDTFLAVSSADGTDTVDGGAGIDTYSYAGGDTLQINLDKVVHDHPGAPGLNVVAANTAIGRVSGVSSTDTVKNFENVVGTNGTDVIYGSAAANRLEGGAGIDILAGFGGNDTLIGGSGSDLLQGGAGRDTLWGGPGDGTGDGVADLFNFSVLTDSGKTKATRDIIMDFEDGLDLIGLSQIDANTKIAGDQAFTYINGNSATTPAAMFSKTAGELRSYWSALGVIVEGDVNGDGKADFSLELYDPNHLIVLTGADFIL